MLWPTHSFVGSSLLAHHGRVAGQGVQFLNLFHGCKDLNMWESKGGES